MRNRNNITTKETGLKAAMKTQTRDGRNLYETRYMQGVLLEKLCVCSLSEYLLSMHYVAGTIMDTGI